MLLDALNKKQHQVKTKSTIFILKSKAQHNALKDKLMF